MSNYFHMQALCCSKGCKRNTYLLASNLRSSECSLVGTQMPYMLDMFMKVTDVVKTARFIAVYSRLYNVNFEQRSYGHKSTAEQI